MSLKKLKALHTPSSVNVTSLFSAHAQRARSGDQSNIIPTFSPPFSLTVTTSASAARYYGHFAVPVATISLSAFTRRKASVGTTELALLRSRPTHAQLYFLRSSAISVLCGGYNYNSTLIRRPFDCLSEVILVTVT